MTNELIDQKQIELHFEKANMAGEQVEKHVKSVVNVAIVAGAALNEAKELIPHGEWMAYLKKHWDYSPKTAAQYMQISNFTHGLNLTEAKSIRDALRIIAEEREEKAVSARSERIHDRVEVIDQDDKDEDDDDSEIVVPDPTPDPTTIRKTAKGSQKPPEASKPKTQPIVPEIVEDEPEKEADPVSEWLASNTLYDAIEWVLSHADEDESDAKKQAKMLRKLADKLDPPTKFIPPTVEDVEEFCRSRNNSIDPEAFVATGKANGWLLSNGNKMKDWKAAIITWEKNDKKYSRGRNNGNGNGRSHNDGSVEAQAARLKEIFG